MCLPPLIYTKFIYILRVKQFIIVYEYGRVVGSEITNTTAMIKYVVLNGM